MKKANIYTNEGGAVSAVIFEKGEIVDVIDNLENWIAAGFTPEELPTNARKGFPTFEPYCPEDNEDMSLAEYALAWAESALVAEIGEEVALYPENMGYAAAEILGVNIDN